MARRRTLPQDCIVCGEEPPCSCTKKPERAKVPRQRKPEPEPTPEPVVVAVPAPAPARPSARDAMRKAAQAAQLEQRKLLAEGPPSKSSLTEEDALTVQALRNLSEHFTVEGDDVEQYHRHLGKPAEVSERSAAWRARKRRDGA